MHPLHEYEQHLTSKHIKTAGYKMHKNFFEKVNIAQDSTINAKTISPNLQEPNREDYQNKEKTQLLKESVRSGYLPQLDQSKGDPLYR